MLTPIDIHNREFSKSFRGYDEGEVDEFLDQVVNDYDRLCRDNEELRDRIARRDRDVEQYKRMESSLQEALSVARRTAEEVTSAAKTFALETKENAAKDCQSMKLRSELESQKRIEEAESHAKKIIEEAEARAKQTLDEAMGKVRVIVSEYDRLVRDRNRFLSILRETMEAELKLLDRTLEEIPNPEACEQAESAQVSERLVKQQEEADYVKSHGSGYQAEVEAVAGDRTVDGKEKLGNVGDSV